jgi:cation transport ATPase
MEHQNDENLYINHAQDEKTPEEPMADAMAFSSSALKARREKEQQEAQRREAETEQQRQQEAQRREAETEQQRQQEAQRREAEAEQQRQQEAQRRKAEAEQQRQQEEQRRLDSMKQQQEQLKKIEEERQQAEEEPEKKPHKRSRQEKNNLKKLKKQDKLRRKQAGTVKEDDLYYGLKLKSRQEYQKEYEETQSFKPIRPEENGVSDKTGTFSYLFDKDDKGTSPEMTQKLAQLHEKRRRRVKKVAEETGVIGSDVAKEDIYSITTAISLKDIRKEAAKKGVHLQPKSGEEQAPVKEPPQPQKEPRKEMVLPVVQEPIERPAPPAGSPVTYRPSGTPVHIVPLEDLLTPVFNESRKYPHVVPQPVEELKEELEAPQKPAVKETAAEEVQKPAQPAAEMPERPAAAVQEPEVPQKPVVEETAAEEVQKPAQPAAEMPERPAAAVQELEAPQKPAVKETAAEEVQKPAQPAAEMPERPAAAVQELEAPQKPAVKETAAEEVQKPAQPAAEMPERPAAAVQEPEVRRKPAVEKAAAEEAPKPAQPAAEMPERPVVTMQKPEVRRKPAVEKAAAEEVQKPAQPAAEMAERPVVTMQKPEVRRKPAVEETAAEEVQKPAQPAAEMPERPVVTMQNVPDRFADEEVPAEAVEEQDKLEIPVPSQKAPKRKILRRRQPIQEVPAKEQADAAQKNEDLNFDEDEPLRLLDNDSKEDELDDYNEPEDAAAIFHQLGGDMRELVLRLTVTGICGILELLFGVLGEFGLFGMQPLNITAYLLCSLIFMAVAVGFCGTTIFSGLKALAKLQANADSGIAVASVVGLVQGVSSLFMQNIFAHGQLHLYAVIVCGALFLNTLGKFSLVRRVNHNFHYITSPDKKYAVEKFNDHNIALQMAEGVTIDTPQIAYEHETGFFQHFLRLSYSDDPSDHSSQFLAPVLFCASLVLFLVMLLFVQPKDVGSALTAFAAATCVSVPLMNMLSVNLSLSYLSRVASQCGGMVVGFPAVQYFSNVNSVLIDAQDLFPRGSVMLNGIKTFRGKQMDDAIVDAAALLHAAGGPLCSLFGQVTQSRQDGMPKVENVQYEDGMGISGWVGGRRVFIGNRRLMSAHNVTPPSEMLEAKYVKGGRQVVYLSVSGELSAMFIVTYRADRHRTQELQRMENNGIAIIVRSNDANVTAPFLAALFHLDAHSIRVLPERLGQVYEAAKKPARKANALIATKGRPTTMMRLVTACVRQRANISLAVVLQNVSAVLGFVLVAFLCCQKGMQQVSTLSMFIYEAFWCLAIWLVPKFRRP